jgi:hypothetical protein
MTYIRRLSLSDNIHLRCILSDLGIVTGKEIGRKLRGTNLDTIQEFAERTDENYGIITLACADILHRSQLLEHHANLPDVRSMNLAVSV